MRTKARGPLEVPATDTPVGPPLGIRDLLPPESRARRSVGNRLQHVFSRAGYELVTTPLFERAEVFENSASLVDSRDLVRFIEPDSGEVVAMRPDITPQIARVVATRLGDHPGPWRVRYEGTVIRRRRGRARKQRQIAQAGVEYIGERSTHADVEVIRLITSACEAAGLSQYRLELSQVAIGKTFLDDLGPHVVRAASEHLARKDAKRLEDVLRAAGSPAKDRRRVLQLSELHGDVDQLKRAERLVAGTAAEKPLRRLQRVIAGLQDVGLGEHLGVDLGEVRGGAYYTGTSFQVLAEGPGEAVASGGRYDRLLRHFGRAEPAIGGAIDVENLLWALDHVDHAWRMTAEPRFLVAGSTRRSVDLVATQLRGLQSVAAPLACSDMAEAERYARAWAFDVAILVQGSRVAAKRISDNARRTLDKSAIAELLDWARPGR